MVGTSNNWAGAPPVAQQGFSFANGELFAQSSGNNHHRRASPAELKAHFTSGSDKDHPAHWFEAQLIHYGLAPSKTKAVARMRLFDAVNAGKISVPAHIAKIEGELKKEWGKNNRAAKKKAGELTPIKDDAPASRPKAKRTAAEVNVPSEANSSRASKKAKTTSTSKSASQKPVMAVEATKKPAKKPKATEQAPAPSPKPVAARARRGGLSQGPSRANSELSGRPTSQPKKKQTARRSNAFVARGRIPAPPKHEPVYRDEDDWDNGSESFDSSSSTSPKYEDEDDNLHDQLEPLGLLNGQYEIDCPFVASEWPIYGSGFELTFTLAGSMLWAKFDLGIVEGVMRFDSRPYSSSYDRIPFKWRGREAEGPIMYGENAGWMIFLGDGRIKGAINFQGIHFEGNRLDGQGTRSAIDAHSMRQMWDGYSEEEYERERVSRWY